jgi:hypothetical protein
MFERLTHRDSKGDVWIKDAAHVDEQGQICMLSDRLAAYEDSGLSPEEVHEFAKAKVDGRMVELFPVDTEVYIVQDGEILAFRIYEFSLLSINNQNVRYWAECVSDENEDCLDFWTDDIGESVFLSREEAEKAIAEVVE